ncbi:DinB family protein [Luteimicrobium sp. NPDC057192]|uniref:DinB family protein n=1 Tax=Luteimicrobium sp. NPDC057192 TaxID=3346042 RepID=UPI00362A03C6
MRFTLSVDLDALPDDPTTELGRILRYWAGNLSHYDLADGVGEEVRDSAYAAVGEWRVAAGTEPAADGAPGAADEKATLKRYLDGLRKALEWKLDGLSERDARRPLTRTGTNLLGLVKHVASTEAEYLGVCFGRPFPEPMPWFEDDAEPNADMWATADESIEDVLAFYRRVQAHSDATVEALPLDAPGRVPWWGTPDVTLHRVLVHMIDETARHAGHADIVRELVDGSVGLAVGNSNLPDRDAEWWGAYVAHLDELAEQAGAAQQVPETGES